MGFARISVETVDVTHIRAECGVRYWEDATVNGVEDADGLLIPHRKGDTWDITVSLEHGIIENWPEGTTASVHYKVCDDGRYSLLDADGAEICAFCGYVPKIMCPADSGYGDYVIMEIDAHGRIADWHPDISPFSEAESANAKLEIGL